MKIMREMIHLKQKESSNDDDDVIEFEKAKPFIHGYGVKMDFEIVDPFTGEKFSPTDLNPSYPTRGKH